MTVRHLQFDLPAACNKIPYLSLRGANHSSSPTSPSWNTSIQVRFCQIARYAIDSQQSALPGELVVMFNIIPRSLIWIQSMVHPGNELMSRVLVGCWLGYSTVWLSRSWTPDFYWRPNELRQQVESQNVPPQVVWPIVLDVNHDVPQCLPANDIKWWSKAKSLTALSGKLTRTHLSALHQATNNERSVTRGYRNRNQWI